MKYEEWQKGVDAVLEAGFLNTGKSCEEFVSLDDLPADDAVAAVEAYMADSNEAIDAFKGIVEIPHWLHVNAKATAMREAQIDGLLRTLERAVAAHIRESEPTVPIRMNSVQILGWHVDPVFSDLGRLVAAHLYDQIEPSLTQRITEKSSDWDEPPDPTSEHWLAWHKDAADDSRGKS